MEEMRQPLEVVRDDQQSTEHESVFRANLADQDAVNEWMEAYSVQTNTSWIVWRVQSVGERMAFHKIWHCQHHTKNKKSGPHNAKCMAKVDVKIKLVTFDTKRRDKYLLREVLLSAVIRIDDRHSHSTDSADALRLLRGTRSTRQTFLRYFSEGMTPSEARRLHESKLSMEDDGPAKLANAALNQPQRTVYHWHSVWREACFGNTHIDPVLKLEEKASLYAAQVRAYIYHYLLGKAVVVVTPIMRRAHDFKLVREIVFVDSTASCDTTKCTATVVLTATKAGAVPLAVLIHKEQSTDGYLAAFKLLKEAPPLCFGGQPAPQVLMSDNSSAEKTALQQTWPSARQLLCHFHVEQAEWRWLTTSHNSVMYADTAEKLEAATAEMKALQHEAFVPRVLTFLRRQEQWVQLYRLDVLTRGHNTNNFVEATTRVLKDIILNRVEAFNAVALVDSVALVWEKYFESRILRHAYSRVAAHQLLYKRLLSRTPKHAAKAIQVVGQGQYIVPSATHPSSSYEVYADIGLCTCLFGKQGAFCKHQALVRKKYGGLFPNAPALGTDNRYQLGQLAQGEKCLPRIFFEPFQEEEPSSNARTMEGTSAQQEEPDELQPMQGTSTQEATHVAPVPSVPDAAQLAQRSSARKSAEVAESGIGDIAATGSESCGDQTKGRQGSGDRAKGHMTEEKKVRFLMRGVKQELFAGLMRNPPNTVQEFVTEATTIEKTLDMRTRQYNQRLTPECAAAQASDSDNLRETI
ncbi:hypothetical protein HPB51_012334 [Rhipicephalus microplus]|uniref:SWIM-type domain-containing protein n=1 Tax=Rhipicephalus microplus TaxID=6941 RepID=A0A9J6DGB7_RHIMP|nr:hypothetical protein HPB51_012334 [Rhipicephalus microplus]